MSVASATYKIANLSESIPPTPATNTRFVSATLTRWPWVDLDLDILNMYLGTKNKVFRSMLSTVWTWQTDRQTDRHADRCDRIHYHAPYASDNKINNNSLTQILAESVRNMTVWWVIISDRNRLKSESTHHYRYSVKAKLKNVDLYSASSCTSSLKRSDMARYVYAVLPATHTNHICLYSVSIHQMAPSQPR